MASIRKRTGSDGRVYHQVRIKRQGHPGLCASFDDYETAYIWSKYKEMLITEKEKFAATGNELYTIRDILTIKYGNRREFNEAINYFKVYDNIALSDIGYKDMMNLAKRLLKTKVRRGGQKNKGGVMKLPEPVTILRKFAYLSSAINHVIAKGVKLDNNAIKIVAYLRSVKK